MLPCEPSLTGRQVCDLATTNPPRRTHPHSRRRSRPPQTREPRPHVYTQSLDLCLHTGNLPQARPPNPSTTNVRCGARRDARPTQAQPVRGGKQGGGRLLCNCPARRRSGPVHAQALCIWGCCHTSAALSSVRLYGRWLSPSDPGSRRRKLQEPLRRRKLWEPPHRHRLWDPPRRRKLWEPQRRRKLWETLCRRRLWEPQRRRKLWEPPCRRKRRGPQCQRWHREGSPALGGGPRAAARQRSASHRRRALRYGTVSQQRRVATMPGSTLRLTDLSRSSKADGSGGTFSARPR